MGKQRGLNKSQIKNKHIEVEVVNLEPDEPKVIEACYDPEISLDQ